MNLPDFIRAMPKVELHVHLEGSVQPETLLALAHRNGVALPADTVEGLHEWTTFVDFPHFIEIYIAVSDCLRTPDDIEVIAREFLAGQAAQNIRYSEVTYTPYTHYQARGLSIADQMAAINRARAWAEATLGVRMGLVLDISRNVTPEEGLITAGWAVAYREAGVVALGLGGPEVDNPPEKHAAAFQYAHDHGLPAIPHAGETVGPESIWGALRTLGARRIGHGVRCLEDPALVDHLRATQIPLEVAPTSNVCLKVAPSFAAHPLPRLLAEGLCVTLNSDDPALFNTTLTDEYRKTAETFGLDADDLEGLVMTALRVSLLPEAAKTRLAADFEAQFAALRAALTVVAG